MNERTLKVLEFDKIVKKLASLTASDLGMENVEELSPQKDYFKVQRLLKETDDGVSFIARRGSPPMGGIHDIRGVLKRVDMGSVLNPAELLKVADVLRACRNLKSYSDSSVSTDAENSVAEMISLLVTNRRIEEKISLSILSEDEIADAASSTLSNIRRQVRVTQDSIKDKLNDMVRSQKYQKFMQESIVTIRGDRYVVPIKQEHRSEVPGMVHDMSSSGATLFIEPMAVVEANNNIKQLKLKEQLEIERILSELTSDVSGISVELNSNVSILGKLDFVFAKAKLSLDYRCVCPKLNNSKHVVVKKGRHPLLDTKAVVPIDFWIGDGFNTLVITGPNTGGKTVTLKTVGLFALMTQSGLHIPADEGTEMCIFHNIYADIGDEQSIEQSLSTFSSHMKNIVGILEKADNSSLVLFDELGAGTDPTEGAALAMSILEHLHSVGAVTIATTHYSELKVYALSTKGVSNACCEFDVQTLKPTYKLLIGIPGKSNAFAISHKLGLQDYILDRAKEFLTQEDIKFEDILLNIEKNRNQSEQERVKAESYRLEAERSKNELEDQKNKLKAQSDKYIKEAKEQARKVLLEAREEAEKLLSEMRKLEMEAEAAARNKAAEEIRQKLKNKVNSLEEELVEPLMPRNGLVKPPKNLKPGDSVLIINLNQKGTVVIPPDKVGQAIIQAGVMKINVHISNLRLVNEQESRINKAGIGKIGVIKSKSISTEVNLRGLTLDDAVETVGKYLDDASLAGLKEITIIHGKGTGVLRNGIHQYLKANPHVKSFRLGRFGEGDTGVTVVELR